MRMTLRIVHGAMTAPAASTTTSSHRSDGRHATPARLHANSSTGRNRSEIGRTSAETPTSAPKSATWPVRRRPHGLHTITSTAPITRKLKTVSDSATAVWKMRLGQRATMAAATRPVASSYRRRATSKTRATVATPRTSWRNPITRGGLSVGAMTSSVTTCANEPLLFSSGAAYRATAALGIDGKALEAGLELHTERVQCERDEVVVAHEHGQLDELPLVVPRGQCGPR